jgi:ribosomal protein L7/L12
MPKEYLFFLAGLAMGLMFGWLAGRHSPQSADKIDLAMPTVGHQAEGAGIKLLVNGNTVEVAPTAMADIQGLIQSGQKIEAIKALRLATGLNLAAAKSVVESLEKLAG